MEESIRSPGNAPVTPGVGTSLKVVVLLWFHLLVGSHLVEDGILETGLGKAAAVIFVTIAIASLFMARRLVFRWLTSLAFSVGVVAILLAATALGTLVVQGLSKEQFLERYGKGVGVVLQLIDADNIFRSAAFRGFLVLLAACLVLVTIRKKAWRVPQWGFLLSHMGTVVILIGGLVGSLYAKKGFIDIHEGERVDTIRPLDGRGHPAPLGFTLRLDKFEVERYPPDYRLYVYKKEGGSYEAISSFRPGDVSVWTPSRAEGEAFRVNKVYPDFHYVVELRKAPEGKGVPALRLDLRHGGKSAGPVVLLAGVHGRDVMNLGASAPSLKFVWELDENEPYLNPESVPERHVIEFRGSSNAGGEEIEIEPGGTYPVGGEGVKLSVLEYYPDFQYDMEKRRGYSRSPRPNNPALRVRISREDSETPEERWLIARMPGFGRMHGREERGLQLTYRHVPGRRPPERGLLVVGKTREILECRLGKLEARRALRAEPGEEIASGKSLQADFGAIFPCAEETRVPQQRSTRWRNPAVEVEVRSPSGVKRRILRAGTSDVARFHGSGTLLMYSPRSDDVKAYRSRVSIFEGDVKSREATISVNHPLQQGGFHLYQSNYRADDPTYSGILAVADPGLSVVYIGCAMLCAGVIFALYLAPRLRRRSGMPGGGGEGC